MKRLAGLAARSLTTRHVLTDAAVRNAMVLHAAVGGSTNLLLHVPAIAHAARLTRPDTAAWLDVNRRVPRLVDALPNGPHPTVRVYLAGGVPEVMLHVRELGLLDERALTASGEVLGRVLDWWAASDRRRRVRDLLFTRDRVDPDDDEHRFVHPWQPGAGGRDRQEHGDRSRAHRQ